MSERHRLLLPLLALVLAGCEPFYPLGFGDGGYKAEALAQFLSTQRTDQLTAGTVTLGEAGTLGRPGSASIGVRATVTDQVTPRTTGTIVSTSAEVPGSDAFATGSSSSVALMVDGGLAIWRGIRVGKTHLLGLAALGTAAVLPAADASDMAIEGGSGLSFGGGFRLGIIEEGRIAPAVSISTTFRNVPGMSFQTAPLQTGDGGTMMLAMRKISGTLMQSQIAVSKRLGRGGVVAGWGEAEYEGEGDVSLIRSGPTDTFSAADVSIAYARTLTFVGGSYRFGRWILGAEVGRLSHAYSSDPFLSFEGQGDGSKTYVSVGVRVGN